MNNDKKFKFFSRSASPAAPAAEQEEESRPRRRGFFKTLLPLLLVAAVLLSIFGGRKRGDSSGVEVITELRSAEAVTGSLEEVLLSGGFLSESESESLGFAGNVRLLSWEVGENEVVVKGQPLATVDRNSVLASISELKELADKLDKALEESRGETLGTSLTAPLAGRVATVFAHKGDRVQDVVAEHGALLLLSLDGRLSLDIPAGELSVGDSLELRRQDGSSVGAQVAEVTEGIASVTVSDAVCSWGESVSVYSPAGEELGSGELGAHRALGITGFSGTVSAVYPAPGAAVYKGQQLLTLSDTGYSGGYESLLLRRQKLEAQIDALYALYRSGALTAPETGYVSKLNTAAVGLEEEKAPALGGMRFPFGLSAPESRGNISMLTAFRSDSGAALTLLGDEPPITPPGGEDQEDPEEPENYTLIGTVSALDPAVGVTLELFSGGQLVIPLADLMDKCDLTTLRTGALLVLTCRTEDDAPESVSVYTPAGGGGGGSPGRGGFSFSFGASTPAPEPDYTAEETELCTLTVFNRVDIVLSVDELDIRSLQVGQPAEVTLDALEGQVFTGSVTGIDPNGVNAGGNTKYTVTVTVDRTGDMLSGMNATVRIPLGTRDPALLLPAEAVQEDENGLYVYTSRSTRDDALGGRKEVTVGFSDGSRVEITSGLSEGETVWYSSADTLRYTFTNR